MINPQPNFQNISDPLGYYTILGISPEADAALVKQSYRDLAKIWHPDHNTDAEALENFQKLSVAYEVLKDDNRRLCYDLFALIYTGDAFPDMENLQAYKAAGAETADIRALSLRNVRGRLWTYENKVEKHICTEPQAWKQELTTSVLNWMLGWWSPQALFKNARALLANFRNVNPVEDNFRILVHNAVAYYLTQQPVLAAQSAVIAHAYARPEQKLLLQKFIAMLDVRIPKPRIWNFLLLRLVQLVFPFVILIAAALPYSTRYVKDIDFMNYFSSKKEISYYQEVRLGNSGSFDDMLVGKILTIPVDKSDRSKLYHLTSETEVMYGPSDEFDVMKKVPAQTTVRLTGMTPDNVWYRIMIDNGEMGFVKKERLKAGIGKDIPYGSAVYNAGN